MVGDERDATANEHGHEIGQRIVLPRLMIEPLFGTAASLHVATILTNPWLVGSFLVGVLLFGFNLWLTRLRRDTLDQR